MSLKEFKPKYKLVDADDPILREELPKFDFLNPPVDPNLLAVELTEHMIFYGGIGLAANQLGLPYRVFAVSANPVLVMFNPNVIDSTSKHIELEEGCLTFPNLHFRVKRPESIKIRYQEPSGQFQTKIYTGMTARIIQHEHDHLNGILYIDYISKLKLDMALKKKKKYER